MVRPNLNSCRIDNWGTWECTVVANIKNMKRKAKIKLLIAWFSKLCKQDVVSFFSITDDCVVDRNINALSLLVIGRAEESNTHAIAVNNCNFRCRTTFNWWSVVKVRCDNWFCWLVSYVIPNIYEGVFRGHPIGLDEIACVNIDHHVAQRRIKLVFFRIYLDRIGYLVV